MELVVNDLDTHPKAGQNGRGDLSVGKLYQVSITFTYEARDKPSRAAPDSTPLQPVLYTAAHAPQRHNTTNSTLYR
jgi:hypothetical protein